MVLRAKLTPTQFLTNILYNLLPTLKEAIYRNHATLEERRVNKLFTSTNAYAGESTLSLHCAVVVHRERAYGTESMVLLY